MLAASSASFLRSTPHFLDPKISVNTTSSSAPTCVRFRSTRTTASYTSAERTRPSPNLCSSKMASSASLYEVLGIPMGATCQEIKAAYRRLARVCHPDVVAINRKETSTDEFMKLHAAYSTLSDPVKRADYDRNLFSRQRPFRSPSVAASASASPAAAASSMSGFSSYSRRTWETDQCW